MFNEEKYKQDIETASKVINLIHAEKVSMLLPNSFWNSTIQNIIELTDGFHYGNLGKKIVIKYNLILIIYVILCVAFSSYAWYMNLIFIGMAVYVGNKFRSKELKKCIQTVALDNPYSFFDAWKKKLFALKNETNEKIYLSEHDELQELLVDVNK